MGLTKEVLPPRPAPCDLRDITAVSKRSREALWMLVLLTGAATAFAQLLEKLL